MHATALVNCGQLRLHKADYDKIRGFVSGARSLQIHRHEWERTSEVRVASVASMTYSKIGSEVSSHRTGVHDENTNVAVEKGKKVSLSLSILWLVFLAVQIRCSPRIHPRCAALTPRFRYFLRNYRQ